MKSQPRLRISITRSVDVHSATPNIETKCSPSPRKTRGVGDDFWGHSDGQGRQSRIGINMGKNCTQRFIELERVVKGLQTRVIAMEGHEQQTEQRSEMPHLDRDWVTCDSNDTGFTTNDTEEVEGSNNSSAGQHRVERTVKKKPNSRYSIHSRRKTTTSPRPFLPDTHSLGCKGSPPPLLENMDNSHNVVSADGSVVNVNNSTITVNYHINNNHHHHFFHKRRYY